MATIQYKCTDCSKNFDLQYLFFKPQKVKCPSCGSVNIKEEKGLNKCGCGSQGSSAGRFK